MNTQAIYLCPVCSVCSAERPGLLWQCDSCGHMDSDADEFPLWSQTGGRAPTVQDVHCWRRNESNGAACKLCRVPCGLNGMSPEQSRAAYAGLCALVSGQRMADTFGT